MKHFLLPPLIIVGMLLLGGCSDKIEYHDEDTIVYFGMPGMAVYKSTEDYYDKVFVALDEDGKISYCPELSSTSNLVSTNDNGKYMPSDRWKLQSGYILERGIWLDERPTQYSYDEYIRYVEEHGKISNRDEFFEIIDDEPFEAFYWDEGTTVVSMTLGEINEMIENGTIEDLFEKLK